MLILVLNTCTGLETNMQFTINSSRQLFPDKIFSRTFPIFSKIPDISLTAVKFPDMSSFSRQVVTLYISSIIQPDKVTNVYISGQE